MKRIILGALLALGCGACTSIEQVNLEEYLVDAGLTMTARDAPHGATPLTVVAVHQTGFYLFGALPIVSVTLEDCVKKLADRARGMGADGVANLQLDYRPASLFKFAALYIPDWSASISLSGMSYRLPTNPAYPAEPPANPPSGR